MVAEIADKEDAEEEEVEGGEKGKTNEGNKPMEFQFGEVDWELEVDVLMAVDGEGVVRELEEVEVTEVQMGNEVAEIGEAPVSTKDRKGKRKAIVVESEMEDDEEEQEVGELVEEGSGKLKTKKQKTTVRGDPSTWMEVSGLVSHFHLFSFRFLLMHFSSATGVRLKI